MAPEVRFPRLGLELGHISTVAFSIGGFEIKWYGLIVTAAVFAGLLVGLAEAKRTKQNVELYFDYFFIAVVSCVVGARLYYVVFSWDEYSSNLLSVFNIRNGGLAIYGAVIAAVISAAVYTRVKKYDFWLFADTGVFGLIIGQVIGRWGNFVNREAFGGYTDGLLALQYRSDTVAYNMIGGVERFVKVGGVEYAQVHPAFLYESLWNLALFAALFVYKRYFFERLKGFTGEIFLLYLAFYGVGRFWIEGLRTDNLMFFGTGIAVSQGLSACLAVFGIGAIVYGRVSKAAGEKRRAA